MRRDARPEREDKKGVFAGARLDILWGHSHVWCFSLSMRLGGLEKHP